MSDLLGTIDLLWPIVLLMIRAQLEWCPVWKSPSWISLVEQKFHHFACEVKKTVPAKSTCLHLHAHEESIKEMKYENVDLVEGWVIVEDNKQATSSKPAQPLNRFKWNQREVDDCK